MSVLGHEIVWRSELRGPRFKKALLSTMKHEWYLYLGFVEIRKLKGNL